MSHRDTVRPSGQWSAEMVPTAADLERFDVAQTAVVNGDDGGAWTPAKPIIIGGSGVSLTTSGTQFTGGLVTATGGRIVIGAGDSPVFASNQSDTLIIPVSFLNVPADQMTGVDLLPDDVFNVLFAPQYGMQSIAATSLRMTIPGRCLHIGASLTSLKLRLRIPTRPASLPSPIPYFYPFALNTTSSGSQTLFPPVGAAFSVWVASAVQPLGTYIVPTTGNTNGFYFKATSVSGVGQAGGSEPTWPTTIGATVTDNPGANQIIWTCIGHSGQMVAPNVNTYWNNGQVWTLEYDWDASGGSNQVDTTTYRYGIVIVGVADQSTTDPTQNMLLHSLEVDLSGISDLRFE